MSTNAVLPYLEKPGLLSPDGKEIVLLMFNDSILRLDAVTLAVLSTTNPLSTFPQHLQAAAVLNDGNVLVSVGELSYSTPGTSSLYLFNLLTQSFTPVANSSLNMAVSSINVAGDGRRALLQYSNGSLSAYDAETGQFATIAAPVAGSINNLDRTGARILSNNSNVYDASLTLLGSLPTLNDTANNACATYKAVISPNGTRAYTQCSNRVYTYDLTAEPIGGNFPAIGNYITATWCYDMKISGDGKTLFLIQNSNATMVPLP